MLLTLFVDAQAKDAVPQPSSNCWPVVQEIFHRNPAVPVHEDAELQQKVEASPQRPKLISTINNKKRCWGVGCKSELLFGSQKGPAEGGGWGVCR